MLLPNGVDIYSALPLIKMWNASLALIIGTESLAAAAILGTPYCGVATISEHFWWGLLALVPISLIFERYLDLTSGDYQL